ncbi:hypothetical protein GGS21DRAFT_493734 [Xylaria nigripes]|nr:hypothetical protein GGS21DRAFT_493734 [Xylaria nigripes]
MFVVRVLLTATAIGAATARLQTVAKRHNIENRQLDDDGDLPPQCQSAVLTASNIANTIPTPPADLYSALLGLDLTSTMPCLPDFTGAVQAEEMSYISELEAWYTSNSVALNSIATACSGLISVGPTDLPTDIPICSGTASESQGSAASTMPTTSSASGSHSPTATSSQSSPPSGAASRDTAAVGAAAVAALGLIGAAAML